MDRGASRVWVDGALLQPRTPLGVAVRIEAVAKD